MRIADEIADTLGNDGRNFVAPDGRTLDELVGALPHHNTRIDGGYTVCTFRDGSAILLLAGNTRVDSHPPEGGAGWVGSVGAWDVLDEQGRDFNHRCWLAESGEYRNPCAPEAADA